MSAGIVECKPCVVGTYNDTSGLFVSVDYLNATNTSAPASSSVWYTCTVCAAGKWSLAGQSVCTDCAGGTWSNTTGGTAAADCVYKCNVGKFSGLTGQTTDTCKVCPAGKFGMSQGMAACTNCPGGTYSAAVGATTMSTCILCLDREYLTQLVTF
jgi:hypothetical protein